MAAQDERADSSDAARKRVGATAGRRRPRKGGPVHDRGRIGRFMGGLRDYVVTAWWGLVTPRTRESRPLRIVQAVILREAADGHEVLLSIRSDLFGWELPGGTLEKGERPEEALVREVWEETGLRVAIDSYVGEWERRGFRPHFAKIYRCRPVTGVLRPSHETPRVGWHAVDRVPRSLLPWYEGPLSAAIERPADAAPLSETEWQGAASIWSTMKIDLGMRWHGLPAADRSSPLSADRPSHSKRPD